MVRNAHAEETASGFSDVWFAKYLSSGTREWLVQNGTSSVDHLRAIAVDSDDNVIVGGETYRSLPGSPAAGTWDIWFAKNSPAGTQQWFLQIASGSSSDDFLRAMAVDSRDCVLVGGARARSRPR